MSRKKYVRPKAPDRELRFTEVNTNTLKGLLDNITIRAKHALAANQEPNEKKRKQMLELITKGKLLVGRIMPFQRRPRTLTEILMAIDIKKVLKSIKLTKERNDEQ